jgi:hypothetical protein
MIEQAKGNLQQSSFYFLLWGWVVVLANLGMFSLLKFSDYPYPYAVWLITIPAWIVTFIYSYKQKQSAGYISHLDHVTLWSWISYGICIFTIVAFGAKLNWNITPIILVLSALPTLLSGVILKFRPLIMGAITFWIIGIVTFMLDYEWQYLAAAIAITMGYLIPGYMLKSRN